MNRVLADLPSDELLRRFQPFAELNQHQLLQLAKVIRQRSLQAGEVLFHCGDIDDLEYFLVRGEVQLQAADGALRHILDSDPQASRQLAKLRPRQYTAVARSDCQVLELSAELLEELDVAPAVNLSHYDVCEDSEDGSPFAYVLEGFRDDLAHNRCVLPSLPEVALKVRQLLDDENCCADQLSRTVNSDPAIAAKLISAANSPIYHGSHAVETTRDAIVRLGLATTRQLVISYAMRDLFNSHSPQLKREMTQVWTLSIEVAAIARVLATRVKGLNFTPDEAMLAGLINDVGVIAVVNYLEHHPTLHGDAIELVIDSLKAEAGVEILKHWRFSEAFIKVVDSAEKWGWQHAHEADLADVVRVAKLQALMTHRSFLHRGQKLPNPAEVAAVARLGLSSMTPEYTIDLIGEAAEQIAEAKRLLKA